MFLKPNSIFYVFFILLSCFEVNYSFKNVENENEYTGKLAEFGQFPFAIRLYSKVKDDTVTYCTATIITHSKLLTAGHCCHIKAVRFVVLGDPDQTDFVSTINKNKYVVRYVKKVIIHPNFERTESKLVYDLCLLILEAPLRYRDGFETVEISYEKLDNKKNCTAIGWGTNIGYEIQHKLYYKQAVGYRCNIRFGNSSRYWFVCLEPHSVCPGDSGGPLVCDGKLYGIASFFIGRGDESNLKCEEGVVDYYSELFAQKDFIEKNCSRQTTGSSLAICVFSITYFCSTSLFILQK